MSSVLSMLITIVGTLLAVPIQAAVASAAWAERRIAPPGEACPDLRLLHRSVARPGTRAVPVVLVHGINTNAPDALWPDPDPEHSGRAWLREAVEAIPSARPSLPFVVDTYAFDYHADSLMWVKGTGPRLAHGLTCLTHSYGLRPIVVAHSMGGLVAQFAAAQSDGLSGKVGDHLAEVITIGTPYQGSALLTLAQGSLDLVPEGAAKAALEAVISACTYQRARELSDPSTVYDGPCSLLAIRGSPVGTALKLSSAELGDLGANEPWPSKLRVHAIAGRVKLTLPPVGEWRFGYAELGDVAVSVESALAGTHDDVPTTVTCDETVSPPTSQPVDAVRFAVDSIRAAMDSACFHLRLIHHPVVIDDVVNEVTLAATASVGSEHLFIVECASVNPCSELVLVRTDSAGGHARVIGGRVDDSIVAVSPDGKQVALVKDSGDRRRLYVRSVATGGDRLLTTSGCGDGYLPSWSPDGHTIAFLVLESKVCEDGVYTVPATGGIPRQVLPPSENPPSWNPTADRWAVTTTYDPPRFPNPAVLYVAKPSGGGKVVIYRSATGSYFTAVWSPDGSMIGVTDENRVILMTPEGEQLSTSSPPNLISQYPFSWARDSLSIVYGRSQPTVYRADPTTGAVISEITTSSLVIYVVVGP